MTLPNQDRVYAQYRDKPKARAWYDIVPTLAGEIADTADLVRLSYALESAEGDTLDVIGRIVVVDRALADDIALPTYQFENDAGDDYEFGDSEIQFSAVSVTGDAELSDQYFRTLIRAKIARNTTDATIESIIASVYIIAPLVERVTLTDNEDMTFGIETYGKVTELERSLLETPGVLPKPQGVQLTGFTYNPSFYTQAGDNRRQFGNVNAKFLDIKDS